MFSGLCYSVPVGRYKPQAVNISCSSKTCQNKDKNNCQPCCYVKLTLISVLNESSGVYSIVLLTCVFNATLLKSMSLAFFWINQIEKQEFVYIGFLVCILSRQIFSGIMLPWT